MSNFAGPAHFDRTQAKAFWRLQAISLVVALFLCVSTWGIVTLIPMNRIPGLVVKGCVATIFSFGILLALFRKDMLTIMKKDFKRG